MIKMYNQPQLKSVGGNPANTGRKWPPVATGGGGGVNKPPPPMAPKPKSSLYSGNNPSLGRSGGSLGSADYRPKVPSPPSWKQQQEEKENSSIPPWKQRQLEKEKQQEQNGTHSAHPWKQKQNENENSSIPPWKKQLLDKEKQNEMPSMVNNIPLWKQKQMEREEQNKKRSIANNIPLWKQKQMEREEQNKKEENIPSWKRPVSNSSNETSNISDRFNQNAKHADMTDSGVGTQPPWKMRQEQSAPDQSTKPSPFMKNDPQSSGPGDLPSRSQNKSFSVVSLGSKPTIERSSGSLGNKSFMFPPPPNEMSDRPPSPKPPPKIRPSFLHKTSPKKENESSTNGTDVAPPPPPACRKPSTRVNGVPRKLPLPKEVYSQPPPIKTSKPLSVILPKKGKKTKLPPPPISVGSLNLASRPLPSPIPLSSRDLPPPPSLTPSLPSPISTTRDLPPTPSSVRDLPPPPIPKSDLQLPPLPTDQSLHPRSSPSPIKGLPSKIAPLPPTPGAPDDIYDDAGMDEAPPPPPPPMNFQPAADIIPQWDDEEEADNIYDETPDEPTPPSGFPMPGVPQLIPEDSGDVYEDVDEYMKLKRQQQSGSISSVDGKNNDKKDKKKKEAADKKDKDLRKKFKLPKEGDIMPCGNATVKETCKGGARGNNLAITAGESIDVIRMNDNPKGKWLVRNSEGSYGYVDSDKVTINIDQLRNTFGVAGAGGRGGGIPEMIPTDDNEVIYDTTADDDVYEEF